MPLETRICELEAAETAALDIETLKRIETADRQVIGAGLYETAVSAGKTAPGFSLTDQDGHKLSLDTLLDSGPVVLSFNRGNWCGYCRLELEALEQARSELSEYRTNIISITPQSVATNKELHRDLMLGFPILSDPGARIASLFGLAYRLPEDLQRVYVQAGLEVESFNAARGEAALRIPVPATYLILPNGQIAYSFFDANYRNRLDPQILIDAVSA